MPVKIVTNAGRISVKKLQQTFRLGGIESWIDKIGKKRSE
jgi:hypothetical protein